MKLVVVVTLLSLCGATRTYFRSPSPWTYACKEHKCTKVDRSDAIEVLSLETCKLTCGKYGALWPHPNGKVEISRVTVPFVPKNVAISSATAPTPDITSLLDQAAAIFNDTIKKLHPDYSSGKAFSGIYNHDIQNRLIKIEVVVVSGIKSLGTNTDENYTLGLSKVNGNIVVNILANTYFGARHGLETLSQLISYDELNDSLQIVDKAIITDKPTFVYRGLLLDTARNFFSIKTIKKLIDGLSYNKMNTLHWHITDTQSFPFFSQRVPKMAMYGAYSPRHVYYPEDVLELVEYGRVRGIRIVPELDAPAHAGYGWQWAEREKKGRMAVCIGKEPWNRYCNEPPCGQLNPLHEGMYKVLGEIYKDMLDVFDSDMFHMGGDEVKIECWNSSSEIIDWMNTQGRERNLSDFMDLWNHFQIKAYDKLVEANGGKEKPVVLWTSDLTQPDFIKYLDRDKYIIQVWSKSDKGNIADILNRNFRVIFSNYDAWYLDCGYGSWYTKGSNWCAPYKGWQAMYDHNPFQLLTSLNVSLDKQSSSSVSSFTPRQLVLGGEAAMWSEQVDESSVETKVWPRLCAVAERLWSNPTSDSLEAEYRLMTQRERMVQRGVKADAIKPQWCHQNQGSCSKPVEV